MWDTDWLDLPLVSSIRRALHVYHSPALNLYLLAWHGGRSVFKVVVGGDGGRVGCIMRII